MHIKRAQTATEYLIILAVVIVIALIVVGILGGIPGTGAGTATKVNSAYWATTEIALDNWAINSTGGVTIIVKNNNEYAVQLFSFRINGEEMLANNVTLGISDQARVNGALSSGGTAGTPYSYNISMSYINLANGAAYAFNGEKTLGGIYAY